MDNVPSSSRGKRSRKSPSKANESFIKNVTSRVSDLFQISRWFGGSPTRKNLNGAAAIGDPTDSSSEDESTDNPGLVNPPPKRMRYDTDITTNQSQSDSSTKPMPNQYATNCELETNNEAQPGPSSVSSRIFLSSTRRSTIPNPYYEPDETTIPSSRHGSTPKRTSISQADLLGSSHYRDQDDSDTSRLNSPGDKLPSKRKSLFSRDLGEQSTIEYRRSVPNSRLFTSSFYPGNSTFTLGSPSLYPAKKQNVTTKGSPKVENSAQNSEHSLSLSSRRMLEFLENYSSPLRDARRLPVPTIQPSDSVHCNSISKSPISRSTPVRTRELHVPHVADLLRIKQKAKILESTSAARRIAASQSSSAHLVPYSTLIKNKEQFERSPQEYTAGGQSEMKNKLKSKTFRTTTDKNWIEAPAIPLDLPEATLSIEKHNLPKFDFGFKFDTNNCRQEPVLNIKTNETLDASPKSTHSSFHFSKPISVVSSSMSSAVSNNLFNFTEPKAKIAKNRDLSNIDEVTMDIENNTVPNVVKTSEVPIPQVNKPVSDNKLFPINNMETNDWKCDACWIMNKPNVSKCVACTSCKPGSEEKPAPLKSTASGWRCQDCWIMNENECEKCIACGGMKPEAKENKRAPDMLISNKSSSEWTCDICWIVNKQSVKECAACKAAKPETQKHNNADSSKGTIKFLDSQKQSEKPKIDTQFSNIVQNQQSKWECTSCLARNEADKDSCACCNEAKPGTCKVPEKDKLLSNVTPTFKFGVDFSKLNSASQESENNQKETITKIQQVSDMKENVFGIPSKILTSETNNNLLNTSPVFSFGMPKTETKQDSTKELNFPKVPTNTSLFKFGLTKNLDIPEKEGSDKKEPNGSMNEAFNHKNDQLEPKENITMGQKSNLLNEKIENFPGFNPQTFNKPMVPVSESTNKSIATSPAEKLAVTCMPASTNSTSITFNCVAPSTSKIFSFGSTEKPSFEAASVTAPSITSVPTINFGQIPDPSPFSTAGEAISSFSSKSIPSTSIVPANSVQQTAEQPTNIFTFGNEKPAPAVSKPSFNFNFGNKNSASETTFNSNVFGNSKNNNMGDIPAITTTAPTLFGNSNMPSGNIFAVNQSMNNPGTRSLFNANTPSSNNFAFSAPSPQTFGTSNTFNSNASSMFGNTASQNTPMFGITTPHAANNNQAEQFQNPSNQAVSSPFGGNNNQFESTGQANMFGASGPSFGTPNSLVAPNFAPPVAQTFGTPNPMPSNFGQPSSFDQGAGMSQPAAPAFNFGASQQAPMFNFGQSSQPGVYTFGSGNGPSVPPVQFNMGAYAGSQAPLPGARKMKRAIRRTANPR